jgi:DNA-binding NtrC family response regulator
LGLAQNRFPGFESMAMGECQVPASKVLIADDHVDVQKALKLLLKGEGYETQVVSSPREILEKLRQARFDALLLDLNYTRDTTSGQEGLDLLPSIVHMDAALPIIVLTAWGSIPLAVEAVRRGARDFVEKPWNNQRLLTIMRTQIELARALRSEQRLGPPNRLQRTRPTPLIAQSRAMQLVLDLIERVAPTDAVVLITGAHGTGKGVVARTMHARSARAAKPLVTVNLGGLSESLFESELFGHAAGAFTDAREPRPGRFEIANSGTLFLDEIGNIPPALQAKLIRILENGEFERVGCSRTEQVNVRVLAATNASLAVLTRAGRFREDLLFRLNTIEIHLPLLQDRPEDIPLLAEHFLEIHRQRAHRPLLVFGPAAHRSLAEYAWPGNVRELDHVVERAVLLAPGETIRPEDLRLEGQGQERLEDLTLEEVERCLIRQALGRAHGNVKRAAGLLGLSRSGLYRRLAKYGLSQGDEYRFGGSCESGAD